MKRLSKKSEEVISEMTGGKLTLPPPDQGPAWVVISEGMDGQ